MSIFCAFKSKDCCNPANLIFILVQESEVVEEKVKSDEPIIKDKSKGKKSKAAAKTGPGK